MGNAKSQASTTAAPTVDATPEPPPAPPPTQQIPTLTTLRKSDSQLEITCSSIEIARYIKENRSSLTIPSGKFNIGKEVIVEDDFDSDQEEIHYTWSMLQMVYAEYKKNERRHGYIKPSLFIEIRRMMTVIGHELKINAKMVHDSACALDQEFTKRFEYYKQLNTSTLKSLNSLRDTIIAHNMCVFTMLEQILQCYEKKSDYVHELYKLIAIFHMIMRITPQEFWLLNQAIGNCLIEKNIVKESNHEATIVFLTTVTEYITHYMQTHPCGIEVRKRTRKNRYDTSPRANFREMKKWDTIASDTHDNILLQWSSKVEDIDDTGSNYSEVPTIVLKQQDCVMKYCCWKADALLYTYTSQGRMDDPDPVTGLTSREKYITQTSWDYIRKDTVIIGVQILVSFFRRHPEYLVFFPAFKDLTLDQLKDNKKFRAHCASVMYTLSTIIENLYDNDVILNLITKTAESHRKRKIPAQPFLEIGQSIIEICSKHLRNKIPKGGVAAWEKLVTGALSAIAEILKEKEKEEEEQSNSDGDTSENSDATYN